MGYPAERAATLLSFSLGVAFAGRVTGAEAGQERAGVNTPGLNVASGLYICMIQVSSPGTPASGQTGYVKLLVVR